MKAWILRWGPMTLVMLLIFCASATSGDEIPEFGTADLLVKKGSHMMGYALLAVSYLRGLAGGRVITRRLWILAVLLSFLYACSDEFHQAFVPGRNPSPNDVLIDTLGAILGVGIWTRVKSFTSA
jgi:VanZ family protein